MMGMAGDRLVSAAESTGAQLGEDARGLETAAVELAAVATAQVARAWVGVVDKAQARAEALVGMDMVELVGVAVRVGGETADTTVAVATARVVMVLVVEAAKVLAG